MKLSLANHRTKERERRYPVLTTLDLTMHWGLCVALIVFATVIVGAILNESAPELMARASFLVTKVLTG